MAIIFRLIFILFFAFNLQAGQKDLPQEELQKFYQSLKCLVCDGQSVYESNAEFSEDIRGKTEALLQMGLSLEEIEEFFVSAYGSEILISQSPDRGTILLWCLPYILLILIFVRLLIIRYEKRRG